MMPGIQPSCLNKKSDHFIVCFFCGILFILPVLLFREPIMFSDTTAYIAPIACNVYYIAEYSRVVHAVIQILPFDFNPQLPLKITLSSSILIVLLSLSIKREFFIMHYKEGKLLVLNNIPDFSFEVLFQGMAFVTNLINECFRVTVLSVAGIPNYSSKKVFSIDYNTLANRSRGVLDIAHIKGYFYGSVFT